MERESSGQARSKEVRPATGVGKLRPRPWRGRGGTTMGRESSGQARSRSSGQRWVRASSGHDPGTVATGEDEGAHRQSGWHTPGA